MNKLASENLAHQSESCRLLNEEGQCPILLVCDHASNHIPAHYRDLGLGKSDLQRHIAWDIGAAAITENLSNVFDAPAVLACFSRLLIDPNRSLDTPGLIPESSDDTSIPGNQNLGEQERDLRIKHYYQPFHDTIARLAKGFANRDIVPLVVAIHSYTPEMGGNRRPWHAGFLWDRDPRLAQAFIKGLRERNLMVGDNEPYSGRDLFHTMNIHGARYGFPQVTVEIRQDEIDHTDGIIKWSEIMEQELRKIAAMPVMQQTQFY